MTVYFDIAGVMTGMRVENTDRKGADIFSFTNFEADSPFNNIDDVYRIAKEKIIPIENVHPSKLQTPTQDEQRMKEWGIQYRVDDDHKIELIAVKSGEFLLYIVSIVFVYIKNDKLFRTALGNLSAKLASNGSAAARDQHGLVAIELSRSAGVYLNGKVQQSTGYTAY